MKSIQGKHFNITDPQGVNTVIYRVNKTAKEYLQQYPKIDFEDLFESSSRHYFVVTFLAILILANKKEIALYQDQEFDRIYLEVLDA